MTNFAVPKFSYKGRDFSKTRLAQGIEDLETNKPAYELGPKSASLGYQAALFEIALLKQLNIDEAPKDIAEAALKYYDIITSKENYGKGNWTSTIIDYDTDFGKPSLISKGYDRIGVLEDKEWIRKNNIWQPKNKKDMLAVDMPPEGWAALTNDGLYQLSGIPFETVKGKQEAVKRLKTFAADHGLDETNAQLFADKNVSYFYRSNKGTGYSPVCRYFSANGSFYVAAHWLAAYWREDLGSFPARSSGKK
jgi:hypothetical protein